MTTGKARHVPAGRLLPEDGIIDYLAVEIAASGTRVVALTRTERLLATGRILAVDGTCYDIAKRLGISTRAARVLAAQSACPAEESAS